MTYNWHLVRVLFEPREPLSSGLLLNELLSRQMISRYLETGKIKRAMRGCTAHWHLALHLPVSTGTDGLLRERLTRYGEQEWKVRGIVSLSSFIALDLVYEVFHLVRCFPSLLKDIAPIVNEAEHFRIILHCENTISG